MASNSSLQAVSQGSSSLQLPADTYIYSLARSSDSNPNTIACIASPSSLVYFDAQSLSATQHISQCHDSVTALSAAGQGFATAGRDGFVKLWDGRSQSSNASMALKSDGKAFSAVASSGNLIAAGTENSRDGPGDVDIVVWDTRSHAAPLRTYTESHNDTITSLKFHSQHESMLLSSSTDALLTLFNTAIAEEEDAVIQVFNNAAAVHCAAFLAPDEIAAVSSDEQMSIFQLSRAEDIDREDVVAVETRYGDVRAELSASYVVDLIQSTATANPETWITSGNFESKTLTMMPLVRKSPSAPTTWRFEHRNAITFPGAHGEEIVRDVLVLPNHRVLSCGEDGTVKAWAVPENERSTVKGAMDIDGEDDESEEESKKSRKKHKKQKREKERFQPY